MLPDLRNVMEEDDVSVVTSIEMTAALVVPAHLLDDDDDKASGGSTSKALQEWVWKHCKDQLLQNLKINRCTANEEKTDTAAAAHVTSPLDESKDDFPKIRRSSSSFTELKLRLLAQIAHVQRQFFQSESPKVVFGWLLESLLELTESEYGFIGELKYDPDGTVFLQTHAITNIAWDQATRKFHDDNVKQGLRFYNMSSLFGSAIRTGKPVISNTPATDSRACGIPKGHPPLHHFLGIPFFKPNGELNGMVGIANRPGGYSEEDIDFLEPFSVTCSNLIQAYVQLEQNRYLINTLEDSVMNRTSELELANTDLELANRQIRKSAAAQLEHFACMSHEIRTPLNCIIGK